MSYSFLKKFLLLSLLSYAVIGLTLASFRREVFPFFNWFLFASLPGEDRASYGILITGTDGSLRPQPLSFREATGVFTNDLYPPVYYQIISRLGEALRRNDSAEVLRLRKTLEGFFVPRSVMYSIVVEEFDPVARYREGRVESRRVLAEFLSEK